MQRGNTDLERSTFTAEIVRQISLHSTILAGAALISLTSVTFPQSSNASLQNAFGVAMSVAAGCHLVALFAAGVLTFVSRMRPIEPNYEGYVPYCVVLVSRWTSGTGCCSRHFALDHDPSSSHSYYWGCCRGWIAHDLHTVPCGIYRRTRRTEQSHALEPAAESVSNRESSPPAQ